MCVYGSFDIKTYEGPGAPVPGFDTLRQPTEQVGPPTTETSTTSTLWAPFLPSFVLILLHIAIPFRSASASPITDHLGVATIATTVALLRRDAGRKSLVLAPSSVKTWYYRVAFHSHRRGTRPDRTTPLVSLVLEVRSVFCDLGISRILGSFHSKRAARFFSAFHRYIFYNRIIYR